MRCPTFLNQIWRLLCIISIAEASLRPTAITLTNNGYSGILVAIDPSVSEDLALIDDIKDMFTDGSAALHIATEKRAYFKEVTILIPNTWSSNSAWVPAASELYSNADVIFQNPVPQTRRTNRLDTSSTSTGGYTKPFTQTYGGCGQHGVRINMFTDLFSVRKPYGPPGKVLVHEWARFRWGVFKEYAAEGEDQFYFSPTTGKLEAVRCNIHMVGRIYRIDPATGRASLCTQINPITGSYDEGCIFNPYTRGHFNDNITASLMDRPEVPSIVRFCNDDNTHPDRIHNYEAPSQHNRICGGRSTWSVIKESPDFRDNNINPPRDVPDTTPLFKVVHQVNSRRIVMAIDTSNSMQANGKLARARRAAASLINDMLDDEAQVGIVTFSEEAVVASPVQKIGTQVVKEDMSHKLPMNARGATSVGAALLKSLQVLEEHDPAANDSFIVLLTDGKDNAKPYVKDVVLRLSQSQAIVNVIAFSEEADHYLYKLATITGGRHYYDNNEVQSTSAVDAMLDIASIFNSGQGKQPVQVLSKSLEIRTHSSIKGRFYIDRSLGRNTKFIVTYNTRTPDVLFMSPTSRPYNSIFPEYSHDLRLKRITIFIPELCETGPWTYKITNNYDQEEVVSVMAISYGHHPKSEPIRLSGAVLLKDDYFYHSRIVAEVTRAGIPVTNLKIVATVFQPVGFPVKVELLDNGSGADIIRDDGLYSRYFAKLTSKKHFSVRIEIIDLHKKEANKQNDDGENGCVASVNAGNAIFIRDGLPGQFINRSGNVTQTIGPLNLHLSMRITDLRVLHTNNTDATVVLAWTAPGDSYDNVKASKYALIYAYRAKDIFSKRKPVNLRNYRITEGDLSNAKPYGSKEQVTVKIDLPKTKNLSLVFAIIAEDKAGQQGELSNLATVGFGYVPDFSNWEYLTEDKYSEMSPKAVPHKQKLLLIIVVGSFSALLTVVVIGTIVTHMIISRKKNMNKSSTYSHARKSLVV